MNVAIFRVLVPFTNTTPLMSLYQMAIPSLFIMLALSLLLHNFISLYSPAFHLNLISIAKMCQSLSCILQFSLDQCIIREKMSLKMIGLAKKIYGLYKYIPSSTVSNLVFEDFMNKPCNIILQSSINSSNVIPYTTLWHFSLDTYLIQE